VLASEIATHLSGGPTVISTAGAGADNGDIFVNSAVSWPTNSLTLSAQRNIAIKANLNGSGSAQLALEYGQISAGGNGSTYTLSNGAQVNLPAGGNFSTKLGTGGGLVAYTVITALGAVGSTTSTDLQGMSGTLNGKYALGANIDASATSGWNSNGSGGFYGFAPVGTSGSPFTGSFDGLGHAVSGLYINRPTTNYIGLFGKLSGAQVHNIGLTGVNITGNGLVGALAGQIIASSAVGNSYATGSVTGTGADGFVFVYYGGLLAACLASTIKRRNKPSNYICGAV
jgi:hypothetical protein